MLYIYIYIIYLILYIYISYIIYIYLILYIYTYIHTCIFMDEFETNFLKALKLQPFVWFRYIDDVFFIWTHGKEELKNFMKELNNFRDHIKFTFESDKENINFLDVNIS